MKNGVRNPMRLSKRGTTLVELIVALSLTAIFAVVCIALINPIERIYKQTERVARAQLLADTIVDGIRKECDNAKNDDINSVWIADGNINNDSGLFDEDCTLRKTEGHILVFKKNNSYCEAIFSELKITEQNKTDANNNSLEGTLSGHAVDDLFQGDKENTEKGIVHFGYYQAGDKGKGVYPLKSYDYTNPVLASTYGDFYVKIYFKNLVTRDVTIDSVTHTIPSFVECEVRVYEGDYIESDTEAAKNLIYTRTAALCFSANGSAPGSSYQIPDKEKTSKEVTVFVIWDDNNNFRNQRPEKVNIVLNYGSKFISHELATNKNPNSIKFVNIDASSYSVALKTLDGKDTVDGYETPRIVWNSAKTEVVITLKQNSVKLVSGPTFKGLLDSKVTGVVFCSHDEALANGWIESSDSYTMVSIPSDATDDKNRTDDYKLYTKGTMAYVTSSDGTFVGNENSSQMFMDHKELTTITDLNRIDTSNVIDMYRMFMNCRKLTEIHIDEWNTENVANYDGMFRNVCIDVDDSVKMTIDISSFSFKNCRHYYDNINANTARTGINKMFCNDTGKSSHIDTIIFPEGTKEMQNIPRLQQVFSGCNNLVNLINFNNLDLSGVADGIDATNKPYTGLSGVFEGCTKLTDVDFSNWNLSNENYKSINSNVFTGLNNVRTINLSGLKVPSCTSLDGIFYGTGSLLEVNLSGSDFRRVESLENFLKIMKNGKWVRINEGLQLINLDSCDTSSLKSVKGMFSDYQQLTTIDMSNFIGPSCTTIESLFENCKNVQTLEIDGWNTINVLNMSKAFKSCGAPTISVADFEFNSVTNMTEMFNGSGAEVITFPGNSGYPLTFSNVNQISGMFQNCKSLTTINGLKNASFPLVTDASSMFGGCESLTNADFDLNLPIATTIANMFSNCKSLKSAEMDLNCPLVENISGLFNGCTSLSEADLELKFNMVTEANGIFSGCTSLSTVALDIDLPKANSVKNLFSGCSALETVDLILNAKQATDVGYLFSGCSRLKTIDNLVLKIPEATNIDNLFNGCSSLTDLSLNLSLKHVTNANNLFNGCSKLENVDLKLDLTAATNVTNMFKDCTGLKTITADLDLPSVTSMNNFFNSLSSLTDVDLSGSDFSGLTSSYSMFNNCSSLKNITMDNVDLSHCTTTGSTFNTCNAITNISMKKANLSSTTSISFVAKNTVVDVNLAGANISGVTSFNGVFKNKSQLTTINLSDITVPNCYDFTSMFEGCSKLKNVNMKNFKTTYNGDTNYVKLKSMFQGCSSLESISFDGWDFSNVGDISFMFRNCTGLKDFTWTFDFTDKFLYANATFAGCTSLETVNLNNSDFGGCTNVAELFKGCTKLKTLKMNNVNLDVCSNFGNMLTDCSSLSDIQLSNAKLNSVSGLSFLSLKYVPYSLDLSKAELHSITSLSSAFKDNTYIKSFSLKDAELYNCTSYSYMFSGCTKMTSVKMSPKSSDNVSSISCESMFYNCYAIESFDFASWDTSKVNNMKRMFCNCAYDPNNKVTQASIVLDISSFDFSKVTTFEEMFNCDNVQNDKIVRITLPSGDKAVDKVNSVNAKRMFRQRRNLLYIDNIGDFTIQNSISDITSMFSASGVKVIDISGIDLSKVAKDKANWMFNNCSNLETIYVKQGTVYNNLAINKNILFQYETDKGYTTPPLKGGNKTAWSEDHTNGEYARVDDPDNGKPGYFTEKTA